MRARYKSKKVTDGRAGIERLVWRVRHPLRMVIADQLFLFLVL